MRALQIRLAIAATAALAVLVPFAARADSAPAPTSTSAASTPIPAAASSSSSAVLHAPGPRCSTNADALYPVICLPAGFGEDHAAPLSAGDDTDFVVQLVDNGPGVPNATFAISFDQPLFGDPDDIVRLNGFFAGGKPSVQTLKCTASADRRTITCRTGPIAHDTNAFIDFDVNVAASAKPGTTAGFAATLEPLAPTTFAATTVHGTVRVVATADLHVSLNHKQLTVPVGHRARITATIHNAGQGPAPETVAFAISTRKHEKLASHFVITNGTKLSDAGGGEIGGGTVSDSAAPSSSVVIAGVRPLNRTYLVADGSDNRSRRMVAQQLATRRGPSIRLWPLHTIAPGQTKTLTIELRAKTVGTDRLGVFAFSDNDSESTDPDNAFAEAKLVAVAARHPAGTGARLAASGPLWLGPLLAGGLLAVLVGTLLLVGARQPRFVARHRH
ncbi:hypothetical protein [uncultured Jatrophihabitans sp.]|uniref:hypothetical protein n=1 Tax=uncultured Jatrophihabitans sp. TaxID=1610747 RepID=UPI0035C9523A